MKNKVLLIIFSAFLLTGCSFIFPNRKSSSETSSATSSATSSISSVSSSNNQSSSSTSSSSGSSSSSSSSSSELSSYISSESSSESRSESSEAAIKVSKTFDFTKAGISVGSDLANSGPNQSLKSYMNTGRDYVSSINANKCTYQAIGQTGDDTLCVGFLVNRTLTIE